MNRPSPEDGRGLRRTAGHVAAAATAALALVPAGSASFAPRLTAESTAPASVTLSYSQAALDDGAAAIALYAPGGYRAKLPTAAGALVGSASAQAVAADIAGATVQLDGNVRVAGAATPLVGAPAATAGEAARACTGSDSSVALWVASLRGFTKRIDLTLAVQRVGSGPLAGSLSIVACPPAADLEAGTPGRAPLGFKLVRLTLRLTGAFTVPAGTHVWHLRAVPYTPRAGTANPAGAVEAEAWHAAPAKLTLAARALAPGRARVSGVLSLAGDGVGGATIRVVAGGKVVATVTTGDSGAFAAAFPYRSGAAVVVRAVAPAHLGACTAPAFPSLSCVTSILAGFRQTTAAIRVPS